MAHFIISAIQDYAVVSLAGMLCASPHAAIDISHRSTHTIRLHNYV